MKKTLSLMILSLLVTQPAFSSNRDIAPIEEGQAHVSTSSGVPISDPRLETPRAERGGFPTTRRASGWTSPLDTIVEEDEDGVVEQEVKIDAKPKDRAYKSRTARSGNQKRN